MVTCVVGGVPSALNILTMDVMERDLEVFRCGVDQLDKELRYATDQLRLKEEELFAWEGHLAETLRANEAKLGLVHERLVRENPRAAGRPVVAARAEPLASIAEGSEDEQHNTVACRSAGVWALSALLASVAAEEKDLLRAWLQAELRVDKLDSSSYPDKIDSGIIAAERQCVKHVTPRSAPSVGPGPGARRVDMGPPRRPTSPVRPAASVLRRAPFAPLVGNTR